MPTDGDGKERWRELAERIARSTDPDETLKLTEELCAELDKTIAPIARPTNPLSE